MSDRITELVLPIKRKWFVMILAGEKTEEYREIKPYWTKRFQTVGLLNESGRPTVNRALVTFRNGYGKDAPEFKAWVTLDIGDGIPEWGAEPKTMYYVLVIGSIVKGWIYRG